MAMQESPVSAEVVGNAFVGQYYKILHHSPELVHRFYQDSSSLSRPDATGTMATVTTMKAINEKILSLKYEDYTAEITTADAQESYEKGVIVLVTGCLTGTDNIRKKFTQTFFLAPQDKGYYVLNDVFRFVEESKVLQVNSVPVNGISENAQEVSLAAEPEPTTHSPDNPVVDPANPSEEEDPNDGAEVYDPSDDEDSSVVEDEVVEPPSHSSWNRSLPVVDSAPETQEDIPKKSYASILKVMKASTTPTPAYVPNRAVVRTTTTNTDQQSSNSAKHAPVVGVSAPSGSGAPESDSAHEETEGHSIYVRNLPYDATVEQLEEEFKKFGPIKRDGIQVRSSKQGFCFGFVEFESLSSMNSALQASPLTIGDRQAVVEEKRTTTRVSGSGRGKFSSGRGGFRSDSFRSRSNFGGSRNYGRNEFRNQGEFSGRGRGSTGRSGEGYQRNQNGRSGRQGGGGRGSVAT
ncbi:ras GTPase-activating protein-binding protein 2 [Morus notabilis]|uniref:ras GTPase-activating protein-binding protein 2 n=1 Tax=Morus notabilis TaxID=981085 RepID=UPI000CED7C91|nr:ras GTPase-activating protein-binding protein 2 [Morus notabilis]